MHFDCPECAAPHEYPDDEIPPEGIVVGCTECGAHIELKLDADFDDAKTGIELPDHEEDDPRARSVRIRLDEVDWSEKKDASDSPPRAEKKEKTRPAPDGPVDYSGPGTRTMIKRALSSLSQGLSLSDIPPPPSADSEPSEDISSASPSPQEWQYRDILLALKAPMNVHRLAWTIAASWLVLIVCANLDALGIWAMGKSEFLGNLVQVFSSTCLYLGLILVGAFVAHHSTRELVHGQRAPLRDSAEWVRTWVKSILGVPMLCLGVVAAVVLVESLVGLLGRIPGAGPVIWGILSPITFTGSLLAGLTVVSLIYALPIYIPLIVLERTSPQETIRRMVAIYRSEGLGLVAIVSLSVMGAGLVVGLVFAPLLYVSMHITTQVGQLTMGGDLAGVVFSTPEAFVHGWLGFVEPFALGTPNSMDTAHDIGGLVSGLVGLMSNAAVLGTFMVITCTAGVIIFGRIRGETKAPK